MVVEARIPDRAVSVLYLGWAEVDVRRGELLDERTQGVGLREPRDLVTELEVLETSPAKMQPSGIASCKGSMYSWNGTAIGRCSTCPARRTERQPRLGRQRSTRIARALTDAKLTPEQVNAITDAVRQAAGVTVVPPPFPSLHGRVGRVFRPSQPKGLTGQRPVRTCRYYLLLTTCTYSSRLYGRFSPYSSRLYGLESSCLYGENRHKLHFLWKTYGRGAEQSQERFLGLRFTGSDPGCQMRSWGLQWAFVTGRRFFVGVLSPGVASGGSGGISGTTGWRCPLALAGRRARTASPEGPRWNILVLGP